MPTAVQYDSTQHVNTTLSIYFCLEVVKSLDKTGDIQTDIPLLANKWLIIAASN